MNRVIGSSADQIIGMRSEQQDRFAQGAARLRSGETAIVHVVADGMGGHSGGAVASDLAVNAFLATARSGEFGSWSELLDKSMLAANRAIGEQSRAQSQLSGMGCTLLAAIPTQGPLHYISVGDSPFFRLRANGLERVNVDHSMSPLIDRAAASGEMTQEEARRHPQRSALRSALVGSPVSLVDSQTIDILPGEVLLLASDGILTIDEPQIAQTIIEQSRRGADAIVAALLKAVEEQAEPEQDNCTIVALCLEAAAPAPKKSQWAAWAILVAGLLTAGLAVLELQGQSAARLPKARPAPPAPSVQAADSGDPRTPGLPYPAGNTAAAPYRAPASSRSPTDLAPNRIVPASPIKRAAPIPTPKATTPKPAPDPIAAVIEQGPAKPAKSATGSAPAASPSTSPTLPPSAPAPSSLNAP